MYGGGIDRLRDGDGDGGTFVGDVLHNRPRLVHRLIPVLVDIYESDKHHLGAPSKGRAAVSEGSLMQNARNPPLAGCEASPVKLNADDT